MKFTDLASRVAIALTLGPLVLATAWFGSYWFMGVVALIAAVSYYEFSLMAFKKEASSSMWSGIALLLLFLVNLKFSWLDTLESIYVITLVVMFRELFKNKGSAILNVGADRKSVV